MTRSNIVLLGVGVILAAIPGSFTAPMRLASMACLMIGAVAFAAAVIRNGGLQMQSALLLFGASNAGFWLSFGLWQLRLRIAGSFGQRGIDPFSGALAEWVTLFLLFSIYEAGLCLWGAFSGRQRVMALLGLLALLIQTATSVRLAYRLIQGV